MLALGDFLIRRKNVSCIGVSLCLVENILSAFDVCNSWDSVGGKGFLLELAVEECEGFEKRWSPERRFARSLSSFLLSESIGRNFTLVSIPSCG